MSIYRTAPVLLLLLFFSLSTYIVIDNMGSNRLLEVYTLVSGLFFFLLSLGAAFRYRIHHQSQCTLPEMLLTFFILVWNGFSFFVFFECIPHFPPLSSYGGFSLFYLIIFSSPLLVLLIVGLAHHCSDSHIYSVGYSVL